MTRRVAREIAMQTLFSREFGNDNFAEMLSPICLEAQVSPAAEKFGSVLIQGVIENVTLIDSIIKKYAVEWDLERIAFVDKNIMRIAIYELVFSESTPVAVVINEALEIAKNYSGREAPRFINGILGKIIKDLPDLRNMGEKE